MKIGMVLDNEFNGDMRVENEVYSLVKAGFEVFVLCFNHGKKPPQENFHGASIIRIDLSLFMKNKMKGLTNTPFEFYVPFWARKIRKFVNRYQIDVLHVHDLYLLPAAFKARKSLGKSIPIVSDLHENYPAGLKHYQFANEFPGKYLISIPRWERSEIEWTQKADHIITVIEEATERYLRLGVAREKITVVANYVNEDLFTGSSFDEEILQKYKDRFVLSYVGGFDAHRGIESVIRALALLKEDFPDILLSLVGAGRNLDELKKMVTDFALHDQVIFEGWQSPSKIPSFIKASNICLIPHLKTEHTDNTIPHKLFQYMLLEKPVLSSNCDPIERILLAENAGLTFRANEPEDLAEKLRFLSKEPERLKEMGRNGKRAVMTRYNWPATAKNLIHLYQHLETA